jgi:hypothetical protein
MRVGRQIRGDGRGRWRSTDRKGLAEQYRHEPVPAWLPFEWRGRSFVQAPYNECMRTFAPDAAYYTDRNRTGAHHDAVETG